MSTLVACVGDSITQGQVSADYVRLLQRRWEPAGFQFLNAGVNGDLAYNVAQRLDGVVARRPDVVTLLIGTNDVNAHLDARWGQRYRKHQHLPVPPTLEWYAEQLGIILTRLQTETDARLFVLDLPMLGEDMSSRMNGLVRDYNAALREVAARHSVPCLPLHDRLVELLPTHHMPPPYVGKVRMILTATLGHAVLRRSWDEVARRNGLTLLTDHIHLDDRAAAIVADLVGGILVA
jgi:lysophospholipase L1-like esterase